tara:strand:+ start:401 stop:565 length:165 start_codon:yes stop_codon:yes gene_type:complete
VIIWSTYDQKWNLYGLKDLFCCEALGRITKVMGTIGEILLNPIEDPFDGFVLAA